MKSSNNNSNPIRFLLNGETVSVDDVSTDLSVLTFLREHQKLTGTKEGCAEGDCGACTVVIGELAGDKVELKTVNACIQFLPTLDGKALFTVESLRQKDGSLHPVQQAMVEKHGSQCGFCTPGFIMSLWNVYNDNQAKGRQPKQTEVRSALTGNLCRCTGYRPILDAAQAMFELPEVEFDVNGLREQLRSLKSDTALNYRNNGKDFYSPKTTQELVELRSTFPEATVLAGGTDIGLWVNKQFRELNPIIYIGDIEELKQVTHENNTLKIGSGVTLTKAYEAIAKYYPEMNQMWERFASLPIRNVGTLGGNIANGSPIGDSMPALIALGSKVTLRSDKASRTLLLEDLYLDYMKKDMSVDEIVEQIIIPLPSGQRQFRCYKLSKRFDSDISAVFAAFSIEVEGEKITQCRIAFGGMAATPKRATNCEQSLLENEWNETTIQAAMIALELDYSPMSDMRASDQNRMESAKNLLYRFYLETKTTDPVSAEKLSVFASTGGTHE